MTVSRREALGALAAAGLLGAGCRAPLPFGREAAFPAERVGDDEFERLLACFGYGARPGEAAQARELGAEAWFEGQLAAPDDEPLPLLARLLRLDVMHLSPWELRDWPEAAVLAQLQQATLLRAVESPWQLRERTVEFWNDHFNVYARKGLGAYRKPLDERLVARSHTFGHFPALLRASARSAAMLVYLDQQASQARHPNENYARELLELHTLGVDGGYTQRDVMEVARCFTGWTEERGFLKAKGAFKFDPALHDDGEKVVLGERIPAGGGVKDGERVLDIVSRHPATARHVSGKLCGFFLGDSAPRATAAVEMAFLDTGGSVKAMLQALFATGAWRDGAPVAKRPFDYAVSAVRALDGHTDGGRPLQDHLAAMGQAPHQWPMPDGYPIETEAWTGTLLARWNFALDLTRGGIGGTQVEVDRLERRGLTTEGLAGPTHSRLIESGTTSAEERWALALASPAFQWR